ncbi:MAG: hypothetical protein E7666_08730 [Ruminococcaceae bacterium]|nr:hypothetical protein [Oscillospiraceae bacterium]
MVEPLVPASFPTFSLNEHSYLSKWGETLTVSPHFLKPGNPRAWTARRVALDGKTLFLWGLVKFHTGGKNRSQKATLTRHEVDFARTSVQKARELERAEQVKFLCRR